MCAFALNAKRAQHTMLGAAVPPSLEQWCSDGKK